MKRVLAGIAGFWMLTIFAGLLAMGTSDITWFEAFLTGFSLVFVLIGALTGARLLMYALDGRKP